MKLPLQLAIFATFFPLSASALPDYEKDVRTVLETHCFKCHGPDKQKSDVRFDTLPTDFVKERAAAETWHDALDALNLGEMPPDDEPGLSSAERKILTDWIGHKIEQAIAAQKSTGGEVILRRLNRVEYRNTMSDLLGIKANYDANLPPDTPSEEGFKNNGAALSMSPMQLEYYLEAARAGLAQAIVTGPAPPKLSASFEKSDKDKTRGNYTNRLGKSGVYVARVKEFPDAGEFVVRVRARAELVDGQGYPKMKAMFGYRADTQAPSNELGVIDITTEESQVYTFRGRMEQFPRQSRTQSKYPGQLIWLTNIYDDGVDRPLQKKAKKDPKQKKKNTPPAWIEYPDFPKVIVESVEFEGPVYSSWPPEHHRRILISSDKEQAGELVYADEVVANFMRRAYRRPVGDAEVKSMLRLFTKIRPKVDTFEEAIRETLALVLVSPDFLYLIEPEDGDQKIPLTDYELASRLSYFLWSTMPDDHLFEAAASGRLQDPEARGAEIDRMLESDRSWQFVSQYTDQWLDLSAVDRVAVNPEYYGNWNDDLKPSMQNETRHFFAEVLKKDLSALNFIDSEFAMLNEPLARHYGIENGPRGSVFERVTLPAEKSRGGLLAQASVLLGNSTGEDSHPILRAVWIRERLLDDPPAPPPPNVPVLNAEDPNFSKLPVRKQLELHRADPACADCHRGIDPWGIALEQFDAIGLWRDEIRRKDGKKFVSQAVEATSELPGGHAIDGLGDLKAYLKNHKQDQFARAFVSRLTSYALGRSLEFIDEPEIDQLTEKFAAEDFRIRPLIHAIVESELFQNK